eukprot:TRINITY_DN10753_c0_g1_i1.p1 TRINITY_DN10753_c0_g1~~TRINITY_DN10753_c0_g1_i1.p1  ORF type:complete len:696 (+),score=95.09 TRINITY_DN10753_c0_g1_i1:1288-3375(+)
MCLCTTAVGLILMVVIVSAASDVANRPPLGWNSWNHFGCGIDDEIARSMAKAMHSSGLQDVGYEYINMDDCWMLLNRTATGELIPNPEKFPYGIESTIDFVHSLDLKFGLYTDRGTKTCAGFAGAYQHEFEDAAQYAAWQVDYVKDDSCYAVDSVLTDYSNMQRGIDATSRPMVLSVEGEPPVEIVSRGGYGNMRRVGHDIQAYWRSMVSLVDIGSGLWSYAHNASMSATGGGGWWNDLDMLEVGNGEFSDPALSRAHMTMWAIMKAPLILGNDLSQMSADTLAVLTNREVLAVNQDALGVQAKRVAVQIPRNNSLGATTLDIVATITYCDAAKSTQRWLFENVTTVNQLHVFPCNASDPYQQWDFTAASGVGASVIRSRKTQQCVDAAANFDPGLLRPCDGTSAAQQWQLQSNSKHIISTSPVHCLDVYQFSGPDVEMGSCKTPGAQDDNQQWTYDPTTYLIHSLSKEAPGTCLSAGQDGSLAGSGTLSVVDHYSAKKWCLDSGFGGEGGWTGAQCQSGVGSQTFTPVPVPGVPGKYTFRGQSTFAWNEQFGASGPVPHSRYVTGWWFDAQGGNWWTNFTGQPSQLRADSAAIIDDDLVGHVTTRGDFCLDLTTMGYLETWMAPCTNGRYAVALFNRSPATDTVTVQWKDLGVSSAKRFSVRDLWEGADRGVHSEQYSQIVMAHNAALLLLTPL